MSEAKETLTPPCALPPGEGAGAVTRGSIAASALAFSRSSQYAEGTVRFVRLDAAVALRAPQPSRRWRSSSDLTRQLLTPETTVAVSPCEPGAFACGAGRSPARELERHRLLDARRPLPLVLRARGQLQR